MKEVVVLSGKGGTGKTTITAALSRLAAGAVLADCDVDAPNLHLLVHGRRVEEHDFIASRVALLDPERCDRCGLCKKICRFDAVSMGESPSIDALSCEGCDLCARMCPSNAITMVDKVSGRWMVTDTPNGMLFHARLGPGEGNSGKLVNLLKRRARRHAIGSSAPLLLIDGPPGIGCPTIAALSGADIALLVAEPTRSGGVDLERALSLCRQMDVQPVLAINRWDLHPEVAEEMEVGAKREGVPLLGRIPLDEEVYRRASSGLAVEGGAAGRATELLGEGLQAIIRG